MRDLIDTDRMDFTTYLDKDPTGTARGFHAWLETSLGVELDLQTVYLVYILGQKFQASTWWDENKDAFKNSNGNGHDHDAVVPAPAARAPARRGRPPKAAPEAPAAPEPVAVPARRGRPPKAAAAAPARPWGRQPKAVAAAPEPETDGPSPAEIREWARARGIEVRERGRVPAELVSRFQDALKNSNDHDAVVPAPVARALARRGRPPKAAPADPEPETAAPEPVAAPARRGRPPKAAAAAPKPVAAPAGRGRPPRAPRAATRVEAPY